MAPYSSTLAWKIPWTDEPGGLQSMGSRRVGHDERLHFHFSLLCAGEGNGNPVQCSFLENPRDGGAWWAAIYGVTQSRTRLKRLSSSSEDIIPPSYIPHSWWPILIDTVLLNSRIYLDFISFPLTWPKILWKTHIKSEFSLLCSLLDVTVTPTSLVLDDFNVSGSTAQRHSRHSRTSFDLTGAKGFGKRTTEILQSPRVYTVHWDITDKFTSSRS